MKISNEENLNFFNKIQTYEYQRYFRRGNWNLVSLIIIILFLLGMNQIKQYWPNSIENPGSFYFYSILLTHHLCFIVCNLIMLIIYKTRVFEKYKTYTESWPWDDNYQKWKEQLIRTFYNLFFNQCIILPLSLSIYYYNGICPNSFLGIDLPTIDIMIFHILIFILCEDFTFYWAHRLLHHKFFYNKIHKIHHQYRLVVSISTEYCHPIEYLFANLIASSSGALVMGKNTHLFTYLIWIIIRISETTDGHSGFEFPWSPFRLLPLSAGQEYHNYHHLNFDGNYGSFLTIWDRICKTTNQAFLKFIAYKKII